MKLFSTKKKYIKEKKENKNKNFTNLFCRNFYKNIEFFFFSKILNREVYLASYTKFNDFFIPNKRSKKIKVF
jgi:hypothetical protein